MPLSILDADDAYLAAKSTFEEWQEQFEQEWIEPMARAIALPALMMALPPEVHAQLRQLAPESYDIVMKGIGRHG